MTKHIRNVWFVTSAILLIVTLVYLYISCFWKSNLIIYNSRACRSLEAWVDEHVVPQLDSMVALEKLAPGASYMTFRFPTSLQATMPSGSTFRNKGVFGETVLEDNKIKYFVAIGVSLHSTSHFFKDDGILILFSDAFKQSRFKTSSQNGRVFSLPLTNFNSDIYPKGIYYKFDESNNTFTRVENYPPSKPDRQTNGVRPRNVEE